MFLVIRELRQWNHVCRAIDVSNMKQGQIDRLERLWISDYSAAGEFEESYTIELENSHPSNHWGKPFELTKI